MSSLSELLYDVRRVAEHREKLSEKRIEAIYNSLMDDLSSFLSKKYVKYADSDGRLYVAYLDSKNQRAKFLQEIANHVDSVSPKLKQEMMALVDETYKKTYQGIVEATQKADTEAEIREIAKTVKVRPEVLKQAVNNNISKLTLPPVMEKFRQEFIYQIQQELTTGLINGDRYETMTKRITERVGVSKSKAKNIVRTESHRNTESGLMDGAKAVQEKLGDDLIYAVTWRTMEDEKVRPQRRRRTAKGWVTTISKNGANHQKMEGVTVKVGEKFKLESGVYAECPGMSGTARNDCNCRCFLEYNLMTPEEFAKATGKEVQKQTKFDSFNLSGIDEEYAPEITDTFNGLMRDYPVEGLKVKTNNDSSEFGHFQGQIKGTKRNGESCAIWNNEICINRTLHKNKSSSLEHHIQNYKRRGSALEKAQRSDLATIPHEYAHAIDSAYVLAKEERYRAFADKYRSAQKITAKDIDTINDFNRALSKSDSRLSKEIFDELQKEYSLSFIEAIDKIDEEYGSYAASSISEFLAEAFANMRILDDSQKTDFMKSFEKIFNRKFKEVFGSGKN